jgi:DNA-binding CsgD family transcriptional regulator
MYDALRESLPSITERQRQVIELIAAGCSNDEVGERLGISPRTAKAHSDVLRQKLGVTRRRQIPVAYRAITGDDPLARSLESAAADANVERGDGAPQSWARQTRNVRGDAFGG